LFIRNIKLLKKTYLFQKDKIKEMKRKLKEELVKMSTDIITSRNLNEITDLYEASKNLYEKLAVLKFIEENLNDIEVDVSKNIIKNLLKIYKFLT